jgi:hypothetical protein
VLNKMIRKAPEKGMSLGFRPGEILALQYADDTVLFLLVIN